MNGVVIPFPKISVSGVRAEKIKADHIIDTFIQRLTELEALADIFSKNRQIDSQDLLQIAAVAYEIRSLGKEILQLERPFMSGS